MSTIVKADATGAVTLPVELCRAAGVAPGADLIAEVQAGRIVLERRRLPIWERIISLTADAPPEGWKSRRPTVLHSTTTT